MKKFQTFALVFILLFSTLSIINADNADSNSFDSSMQFKKGFRYNNQGWIYCYIEGDAYDRGYQHGYLLSAEIADMLNIWGNTIHNHPLLGILTKRLSEERYDNVSEKWWNFCTNQCHKMYWDKYPPEYKSEIEGIADGVNAQGLKIHNRNVTAKDILTMNQMYEFMSKLSTIPKGIHPVRKFFHQIEEVVYGASQMGAERFIDIFLNWGEAHHCNGFIASGNATTNGQIVITHSTICGGSSWWWTYAISLRWNVILDINPSNGYRMMFPTSPGHIWSDEDYYQNINGIVFLETTLPQGIFDNKGLPLSVRARKSVQYAENIDDVIYNLRNENDGSMNAVWLIGDTKTGEICRFELGYRAYAIWRTYDGFYWSANNPFDIRLRLEKFDLKEYIKTLAWKVVGIPGFGYHSLRYRPIDRDIAYEELGNKYYGDIDVDVVKEIATSSPICDYITDTKISDTNLVENHGIWAFFGNPKHELNFTVNNNSEEIIKKVFPCGWTRIYGVPAEKNFELNRSIADYGEKEEIIWKQNINENTNDFYSKGTVFNDNFFLTTSSGKIHSIDPKTGKVDWSKNIGEKPTKPITSKNLLIVGHSEGITALDFSGKIKWEKKTSDVLSTPLIINNSIYFGNNTGSVFEVSKNDGEVKSSFNLSEEIYISEKHDNYIYINSNKSCYSILTENNSINWEYQTNGKITISPIYNENMVYFGSWDNYFYSLNATNGELIWKTQLGWGFDSKPAINDNLIIVPNTDNNVYALNLYNGSIEWIFSCRASIHSDPVAYGDFVFFGCDDGRFYALNSSNGKSEWHFAPELTIDSDTYNFITTPIVSDPIIYNQSIIIGSNGTIYSLDTKTIEHPPEDEDESEDDEQEEDDGEEDDEENNNEDSGEEEQDEQNKDEQELLDAIKENSTIILTIIVISVLIVISLIIFEKKRNK